MKTDDAECEWCPVKLDTSGVYIAPGEWGCCNDACPKTIDKGNNTNKKDFCFCCQEYLFKNLKKSETILILDSCGTEKLVLWAQKHVQSI